MPGSIALIALRILYLAAFGDHAGRKEGLTALIPDRGDIVDRDGEPLARTIDAWTIAVHPNKVIGDKLALAQKLAQLMPEHTAEQYFALLRSDKPFFYLRRRASPDAGRGGERARRAGTCDRARAGSALPADQPCRARPRLHRHRRPRRRRASSARSTASFPTRARAESRSTLSISSRIQQALEAELGDAMSISRRSARRASSWTSTPAKCWR